MRGALNLIGAATVAGVLVIIVVAMTAAVTHHSFGDFTRDWRSLAEEAGVHLPFYTASLSILNIIAWAVGGSLALLAGYLLPARRRWLLTFGGFLCLLTADDALTLHENAFGLEVAIYVVYGLIGLALVAGTRQQGFDGAGIALVIGGAFLAASLIADQLLVAQYFVEDVPKLIGAFVWITVPLLHLRGLRVATTQVSIGSVSDAAAYCPAS